MRQILDSIAMQRIAGPSSEMRDAALPRADVGEWRGRSGIPNFPRLRPRPPRVNALLEFSVLRGAKDYVRNCAMIKLRSASHHHILFRAIVANLLGWIKAAALQLPRSRPFVRPRGHDSNGLASHVEGCGQPTAAPDRDRNRP